MALLSSKDIFSADIAGTVMDHSPRKPMAELTQLPPSGKKPRIASSEGQQLIGALPHEIVVDILKRLPVRDLLSFRLVCKEWNRTIESGSFVEEHLKQQSLEKRSYLLFKSRGRFDILKAIECGGGVSTEVTKDIVRKPSPKDETIFGGELSVRSICRGLVCAFLSSDLPIVFIWNPFTGKHREVPDPEEWSCEKICSSMCLGYDPTTDDYKIVYVEIDEDSDGPLPVQVFSVKKNVWRKLEPKGDHWPKGAGIGFTTRTLSVATDDGSMYLGVMSIRAEPDSDTELTSISIFKFDLVEEEFSSYTIPPLEHIAYTNSCELYLYNGLLCLYQLLDRNRVDIWLASEDRSWSLIMTIPILPEKEISGSEWRIIANEPSFVGPVCSVFGLGQTAVKRCCRTRLRPSYRSELTLHFPVKDGDDEVQIVQPHSHASFSGITLLPVESLVSP